MTTSALAGRRILLVEDEYFIAADLMQTFAAAGAEIVGPAASLEKALSLLAASGRLDGAVLDINLRGETVYPVADILASRGVPFVFATGYDAAAIPPRYRQVTRCEKPVAPGAIARRLFG